MREILREIKLDEIGIRGSNEVKIRMDADCKDCHDLLADECGGRPDLGDSNMVICPRWLPVGAEERLPY